MSNLTSTRQFFPLFEADDLGDVDDSLNMAEMVIEGTSGTRRWTQKINDLRDFRAFRANMLKDIIGDVNADAERELRGGIAKGINFLAPLLPFDTGQLKAGFVSAFHINTLTDNEGNAVIEMIFDFQQWLTQVPYARFHIEELSGKSSYKEAIGKPLDLELLIGYLAESVVKIFDSLEASGYRLVQRMTKEEVEAGIRDIYEEEGIEEVDDDDSFPDDFDHDSNAAYDDSIDDNDYTNQGDASYNQWDDDDDDDVDWGNM